MKTVTSDDLTLPGLARGAIGVLQKLFERLHGRSSEQLHECEGMAVQLEGAFMRRRELGSTHLLLYVRFRDKVLPTSLSFAASDPVLAGLPIERFGPSPEAQRLRNRPPPTPGELAAFLESGSRESELQDAVDVADAAALQYPDVPPPKKGGKGSPEAKAKMLKVRASRGKK